MFTQEEKDFLLGILKMNEMSMERGLIKAQQLRPNDIEKLEEFTNKQRGMFAKLKTKIANSNTIV